MAENSSRSILGTSMTSQLDEGGKLQLSCETSAKLRLQGASIPTFLWGEHTKTNPHFFFSVACRLFCFSVSNWRGRSCRIWLFQYETISSHSGAFQINWLPHSDHTGNSRFWSVNYLSSCLSQFRTLLHSFDVAGGSWWALV